MSTVRRPQRDPRTGILIRDLHAHLSAAGVSPDAPIADIVDEVDDYLDIVLGTAGQSEGAIVRRALDNLRLAGTYAD